MLCLIKQRINRDYIGQGWPEKSDKRRRKQDVAGRKTLAKVSAGAGRKTYQNLLLDAAGKAVRKRLNVADNYSRRTLTGKPDREPAVYLLSKPEIQDNAYYQELSTSLILAVIASYLFRVSLRIIER